MGHCVSEMLIAAKHEICIWPFEYHSWYMSAGDELLPNRETPIEWYFSVLFFRSFTFRVHDQQLLSLMAPSHSHTNNSSSSSGDGGVDGRYTQHCGKIITIHLHFVYEIPLDFSILEEFRVVVTVFFPLFNLNAINMLPLRKMFAIKSPPKKRKKKKRSTRDVIIAACRSISMPISAPISPSRDMTLPMQLIMTRFFRWKGNARSNRKGIFMRFSCQCVVVVGFHYGQSSLTRCCSGFLNECINQHSVCKLEILG